MHSKALCNDFEVFLHNIVWLRKHHGLSKKQLANLLGVGLWTLNKLEKGELPPKLRIDIVFSVQEHFGIHPKDQFGKRLA